jgi:hypothetical protein
VGADPDPLGGIHNKLDQDRREDGWAQYVLFSLLGLFCVALGVWAAVTAAEVAMSLLAVGLLVVPGVIFVLAARWGRRYLVPEPLRGVEIDVPHRTVERGAPVEATVRLGDGGAPVRLGLRCETWSWRLDSVEPGRFSKSLSMKVGFEEWAPELAAGPSTTVTLRVPPDAAISAPRRRWVVLACRSKRPPARRTEVPVLVR